MTIYATKLDRIDLADDLMIEPDWTLTWETGADMELQSGVANNFGDTILNIDGLTTDAGPMVRWTRPEDGNHADVDILFLFNMRDTLAGFSTMFATVRASGVDATSEGYRIGIDTSGNLFIGETTAAVTAALVTDTGVTYALDTWYWGQLRVIGDNLKARAWEFGGVTPKEWQLETTDATITAAGFIGLGCEGSAAECDYDFLSVGTGGDFAPLPRLAIAQPTLNTVTLFPARVRVDATSLAVFSGLPLIAVDWSLFTGDGTLTPITNETNEQGIAFATYTPGTEGDKTVRATYGT